jgi:hypothetical protein
LTSQIRKSEDLDKTASSPAQEAKTVPLLADGERRLVGSSALLEVDMSKGSQRRIELARQANQPNSNFAHLRPKMALLCV